VKLNKAIRARYPLAPPCPTDAYKKATKKRRPYNKIKFSAICFLYSGNK
jgi:hypothetical protein